MGDHERTTILFAGGGTGGHLYPGVSVAQALVRVLPNVRPLFLCTTRPIDRTILEPTGFDFIEQPIIPLAKSIGGLLAFLRSWRETMDLLKTVLREQKPAAVLGLGGYAAGPAVKVSGSKHIPAAILNPDVIPGKANTLLLRYVEKVCCQFDATRSHLTLGHQNKMVVTGCPIRHDLTPLPPREEACKRVGVDPRLQTLMITGASQGAQTVNEAVIESLKSIKLQGWNILHLAGKDHAAKVRAEYRELNIPAVVIDFTSAMADIWAVSDLVVCRSGASTCAELTACGKPSILMPYPYHKDMHQRANAQVLADSGAAVLFDDEKDRKKNADRLRPILEKLLYDAPARADMATKASTLGRLDAADAVVKHLREIASL